MGSDPTPAPARTGWGSLRQLTRYQWFVFVVACLAWDLDCMDQQLFNVARRPAMRDLVPQVQADDPKTPRTGGGVPGIRSVRQLDSLASIFTSMT